MKEKKRRDILKIPVDPQNTELQKELQNGAADLLLSLPILLAGWFLNTLIFPESMNSKQIKPITFESKVKPSALMQNSNRFIFSFSFP